MAFKICNKMYNDEKEVKQIKDPLYKFRMQARATTNIKIKHLRNFNSFFICLFNVLPLNKIKRVKKSKILYGATHDIQL